MSVASRLKFRIGCVVDQYPGGQTPGGVADDALPVVVGVTVVEQRIRLFDGTAGRWFGAVRLRLFDGRGDIRRGDRVEGQTRLDAVEPEGCQHEQPRDERHEQPGHMAK